MRRTRRTRRNRGRAGVGAILGTLVAGAVAYREFGPQGSYCGPPGHPVQGVDVSRHQGDIDWQAVARSGIRFAWVKATEGGDHLDEKFRQNWQLSRTAGVLRGAYHFIYWCRSAKDQASWFVTNVPNDPDALPPVLDVEWNPASRTCPEKVPREKALADTKIILQTMEHAFGKRPIIYAPPDFFHDVMVGELQQYPLWVRNTEGPPERQYADRRWLAWQYTETGSVPGIAGSVDRNCYVGGLADWRKWSMRRVD